MSKITVVGSGTMGNGIAHVFALNGYSVSLIDINEEKLISAKSLIEKNLLRQSAKNEITQELVSKSLSLISFTTNYEIGISGSELVIEVVSENIEIKKKVIQLIDSFCSDSCIIASNTSSISITKLASFTKYPEKFIGMHFMNPVPVMPLIEVIKGYHTSSKSVDSILQICTKLNKTPIIVNDFPGFVANRILMPMINEAICTLNEGVADTNAIDQIMKLGMAHPMGPLKLADYIGLDVCLSILKVLYEGFGNQKYAPNPLLVNMVEAGNLGVKTGVGFYDWSEFKNPTPIR